MTGTTRTIRIAILYVAMSFLVTGCLMDEEEAKSTEVAPVNSMPAISGSPALECMASKRYAFRPNVNDADGDTLTFSVSALPRWASFNSSTGELSGTPQSGDVGTYSNISITVSDGSESATLGPFAIIVKDTTFGSVTLSWTAPTENEDGSVLTDLDGYRLYWGKTPGDYTNSVTIDNASITTYVVDNIAAGTYEFVGTSFNTAGVESRYSNPATKVVL